MTKYHVTFLSGPNIETVTVVKESRHYVWVASPIIAMRLKNYGESEAYFDTEAEAYTWIVDQAEKRLLEAHARIQSEQERFASQVGYLDKIIKQYGPKQ